MNNEIRLAALKILQEGRKKLIDDVSAYNGYQMFRWLFKHRKNLHGKRLAFYKYFFEWINAQLITAFEDSRELGVIIVKLLSPFIEEWEQIEKLIIGSMVPQLLTEKTTVLQSFMNVEDMNEMKLNKIRFMMEKDDADFEKMLEELAEE
ncbi:MAG: hypothetical protein LBQ22_00540 [Bacteroidales bacterium]|jgi:hypothetical protein|nr:hypothetical protein [Bacteroidales bacterium]